MERELAYVTVSIDAKKNKLITLLRVKKNKKTLKYKLNANQVMLLVIRLTMKKNNITTLLQHYSSQWLVGGQY